MFFFPVPPTINRDTTEFTVTRGNSVVLPCDVRGTPAPTVSWFKDNIELHEGEEDGVIFLPNGAIRINEAEVEHAGSYECRAESEAGQDSKHTHVNVHGR